MRRMVSGLMEEESLLFHIKDFLTGGVLHLPAVLLFCGAEEGVVVSEGHRLYRSDFEVLNEEERIALRVCTVFVKPCHDGLVLLGMFVPFQFGGRFAISEMDVAAYLLPIGFKVKCQVHKNNFKCIVP